MTKFASTKWTPFKVGDCVWLDTHNIDDLLLSTKLKPRRCGPFKVKKVHSKLAYWLALPKHWKLHLVIHTDMLSHYHTNEWYSHAIPAPNPESVNGQEEYEVEKILGH